MPRQRLRPVATGAAPMGEMGSGASHFNPHRYSSDSRVFLNQGFVTGQSPRHVATFVPAGRFDSMDGAETTSADPTIEWIRQARGSG